MSRVLLVDDSSVVRGVLKQRLADRGYQVVDAADGVTGAEMALADPPDLVLTDLWMPGISGVQLCRLLRSEPRTAHVPVILVTGESDRRSRFWARCAGAAAYVAKADGDELFRTLERMKKQASTFPPEPPRDIFRGTIQERLSQRLDAALFESIVAGEVRALAKNEGDIERLWKDLVHLASDIASYRWLALSTIAPPRLLLHATPQSREACETEAREALSVAAAAETIAVLDDRPVIGRAPGSPLLAPVTLGRSSLGMLALGPTPRSASREDARLVELIAAEVGGPLRIVSLVEESRRMAMTDPLTALMNRRAFADAMHRELAAAERHKMPLSLLLLDIDHFKRVNDTRGHEGGDLVLRGLAEVLRRIARKSDILGRWGGEEFVVGLPQTAEAGARIAADRTRRAIASSSFALAEGSSITATASIGIACLTPGESLEALVARADQAMYSAKTLGRNRVEVAPSPTPPGAA